MNPILFYTNPMISIADKLLEGMYFIIGMVSMFVAFKNIKDKGNPHPYGTFLFWFDLGLLFAIGKWIPNVINGLLLVIMTIPAILKRVFPGTQPELSAKEIQKNNQKIGSKIFIPALCIGLVALLTAFCTKISPLVGMGAGVFLAMIILRIYSKENTISVFMKDCRRMMDVVGPLSMLPLLLAALGSIFTAAGCGDVISQLASHIIPDGNVVVGIIVYALGMVIFTMLMGSAFAAITVMTVGIGAPFVLKYGVDPVVIGSLALTCGYCGTLCTPMAANFNIIPVAILDMKDKNGVIKNQIVIAIIMLIVQIGMMILLS